MITSAMPIVGNEVLRDVVGRFAGVIQRLVAVPNDDISNFIVCFNVFDNFSTGYSALWVPSWRTAVGEMEYAFHRS